MSTLARFAKDARASRLSYGYKAQIVDNAEGAILDHNVQVGNPPDTELTSIDGARTWCGHGVFAHNLVKIGTLAA